MQKYKVGDTLKCIKRLELFCDDTKEKMYIEEGSVCEVIFAEYYDGCSYYEIAEKKENGCTARLFNDPGHEIVDWTFAVVKEE